MLANKHMGEYISFNIKDQQENQSVIQGMVKSIWHYFMSLDKFTKLFLITAVLLTIATPVLVSNLLQTKQHAGNEQPQLYFALHGSKTPITNPTFVKGETVLLDVYLDGKTENITGFDIAAALASNNTLVLAQPGVTEGADANKFSVSLINNWENNRWRYTKVNTKTDSIITGPIFLATIPFTALSSGVGTFDFTIDTAVTSAASAVPLSVAKYALAYTVAEPTPTPTPSAYHLTNCTLLQSGKNYVLDNDIAPTSEGSVVGGACLYLGNVSNVSVMCNQHAISGYGRAWPVLIERNAKNITFDNCIFGKNSSNTDYLVIIDSDGVNIKNSTISRSRSGASLTALVGRNKNVSFSSNKFEGGLDINTSSNITVQDNTFTAPLFLKDNSNTRVIGNRVQIAYLQGENNDVIDNNTFLGNSSGEEEFAISADNYWLTNTSITNNFFKNYTAAFRIGPGIDYSKTFSGNSFTNNKAEGTQYMYKLFRGMYVDDAAFPASETVNGRQLDYRQGLRISNNSNQVLGTSIFSFDPENGQVGSDVILYIKNMVVNKRNNIWNKQIFINGKSVGIVGTSLSSGIFAPNIGFPPRPSGIVDGDGYVLLSIPEGATAGKFTVTTFDNKVLQSSKDFTVIPGNPIPIISNFSPTGGPAWTGVDINGRNFGSGKSLVDRRSIDYGVFFNSVQQRGLDLSDSTWQSRGVMTFVPEGAQIGKITLKNLWGQSVQSDTNFIVTNDFGESKRIEANQEHSLKKQGSLYGEMIGNFNRMTIEFWISPTSNGTILSKGNAFMFNLGQDKKLLFKYSSSGELNNNLYSTSQINTEVWTHVAAVYDGSTVSLYINGRKEAQKSQTAKIMLQGSGFPVSLGGVANPFIGKIDELRISNIARYSGDSFSIPSYIGDASTPKQFTQDTNTIILFHFNRTTFGQGINGEIVNF